MEGSKKFLGIVEELLAAGALSVEEQQQITTELAEKADDPIPSELTIERVETVAEAAAVVVPSGESDTVDLRKKVAEASFGEKVKFALLGNATCRGLLIRDTNKLIQLMVLKNPRMSPGEVEEFSKNSNLSDKVLRAIADNKSWTRSYKVKVNLVSNPKTPGDVALKWLKHLQPNEIRSLSRSKNISQIVATAARKMAQDLQEKG
jgi:hypothetical protein